MALFGYALGMIGSNWISFCWFLYDNWFQFQFAIFHAAERVSWFVIVIDGLPGFICRIYYYFNFWLATEYLNIYSVPNVYHETTPLPVVLLVAVVPLMPIEWISVFLH